MMSQGPEDPPWTRYPNHHHQHRKEIYAKMFSLQKIIKKTNATVTDGPQQREEVILHKKLHHAGLEGGREEVGCQNSHGFQM